MRTAVRQSLLLAEVIVLFGPATILLGASPLGFLAALESSHQEAIVVATLAVAGGVGIIAVIKFVLHTLDPDESLPPMKRYFGALIVGSAACAGALIFTGFSLASVSIFVAPIVGAAHLAWLARREFGHAT